MQNGGLDMKAKGCYRPDYENDVVKTITHISGDVATPTAKIGREYKVRNNHSHFGASFAQKATGIPPIPVPNFFKKEKTGPYTYPNWKATEAFDKYVRERHQIWMQERKSLEGVRDLDEDAKKAALELEEGKAEKRRKKTSENAQKMASQQWDLKAVSFGSPDGTSIGSEKK